MTKRSLRVGVVAGAGELPVAIVRSAVSAGRKVYAAALEGAADPAIEGMAEQTEWYTMNRLGRLVEGLRKADARDLVLAGKVPHQVIYSSDQYDQALSRLMAGLADHGGYAILAGLVDYLTKEGFNVLSIPDLVPDLLAGKGLLAGPGPSPAQLRDVKFGFALARQVATLDIGQTVVVKGMAVVAVEAMEGTDGAIRRAGELAGGRLVVVKAASRDHDFRFDVPTIGPTTARTLASAGGGLLAVETGRCLILKRQEVCEICDREGVTLFATEADAV